LGDAGDRGGQGGADPRVGVGECLGTVNFGGGQLIRHGDEVGQAEQVAVGRVGLAG
jgi:hypothetical protein